MKNKNNKTEVNPFWFYTRLSLAELTGLKASTLTQLLRYIKEVPPACIYNHTHRFLQIHQHLCPEPPNDFAYWVANVMKDDELAESLASVDTVRMPTLKELRDTIAKIIEIYLKNNPKAKFKFVKAGQEFHFIKAVSFIVPSKYVAYSLKEFEDALKCITIGSIYFHMFEARIRLEKGYNDFSFWLDTELGEKELAKKVAALDPYSFTMEGLRFKLILLIEEVLRKK